MSMFCFQCQEAANGKACEIKGVCGKDAVCAGLQDLLVYTAKGVAIYAKALRANKEVDTLNDKWLLDALFTTITNANFDKEAIEAKIVEGLELRDALMAKASSANIKVDFSDQDAALFDVRDREAMLKQAAISGVKRTENEDVRSLRELIIYGLKGLAAYAMHAANLGSTDADIIAHIENALVATLDDTLSADDLVAITLETGKYGVEGMVLLDAANTGRYGNPEISTVELGVGTRPGILVSGHDLSDLEELLEQSKDSGVDIYTHSEMLPAHYYPELKKYSHLKGNYGNAWWQQVSEFETFNGPVLFTTNCIVPPKSKSTYTDKVFTTGSAGYPGFKHLVAENGTKDYSEIIELAKTCEAPEEIESGTIVGGFAHNQVIQLADKVLGAINEGAIRKFVVMAGCDGRMKGRNYYEEFAKGLPEDVVILTAGCAKYRYNKLDLGDIGGIPRVLDAGQCNDSYSLAKIAITLRDALGLEDLNDLPIAYNIAWYEQKAVIVLLALLYLGVKNIHLGPTLPAFLSPNVVNVLVENFGIAGITTVDEDLAKMVG